MTNHSKLWIGIQFKQMMIMHDHTGAAKTIIIMNKDNGRLTSVGLPKFFYFVSAETRKSNFHTPLHAYGGKLPPTTSNIKQQKNKKAMQKVQNAFGIYKLETNEKIVDLAETRGQIYCRVAILPNGDESTLTDAQKALLSSLSEKQRNTTLRGQLEREISNVFPVSIFSDYIDKLDEIAKDADYFSEEGQNEIISQLSDLLKNEKFIFTYYTESVDSLLRGTEYDGTSVLYYETSDGVIKPVRSRNNLYFGFFDSEEECFSFMQSRLLSDIDDGNILLENPNSETEEKPKTKSEKPKVKLSLKR